MKQPFVIKDVNLRLWQMFILTFPYYILPSGLPRISDIFIVSLAFRYLAAGKVPMMSGPRTILKFLWLFVAYVFVISAVFALYLQDFYAVQTSLFYFDNALAVTLAFALYSQYRERFLQASFNAIALCVTMQFAFGIKDLGNPNRATIFFNNPNQLGYFALIAASLLVYLSKVAKVKPWQATLYILICFVIALISLSKAAIVGFLFLFLIHSLRQPVVLITSVVAILAVNFAAPNLLATFDRAQARVAGIGTANDDSLEGRGYTRIIDNPQYLSFGSSEGQTSRWTRYGGREIHSIFGTLLFAYGFPGVVLLSLFLYYCFKGQGWHIFPMFAIAFYGITHQGLRFTLLWCLLAISWCVVHTLRERQAAKRDPVPINPQLGTSPA